MQENPAKKQIYELAGGSQLAMFGESGGLFELAGKCPLKMKALERLSNAEIMASLLYKKIDASISDNIQSIINNPANKALVKRIYE